jgi:hypothetical protein
MAAYHTLGAVQIPRGMVWVDEFTWHAVERCHEYSITGALVIDVAARQAGRPITLQGDDGAGWITRATLLALHTLATSPDSTYALTLADGRVFAVKFAPGSPLEARPIGRPELPPDAHPYAATLRLIEI